MQVIFTKDVGGAGRVGEVKDIADGFALNFLIPRGFAIQATPEALAAHKKRTEARKAAEKAAGEHLAEAIKSLSGERVTLKVRATEKGGLFKQIGPKEIVAAIVDQKNIQIPEESVRIMHPIKTVGEHTVALISGAGDASITLVVEAA